MKNPGFTIESGIFQSQKFLFSVVFPASAFPFLSAALNHCKDQNQNSGSIQTEQNIKRGRKGTGGGSVISVGFRRYDSGWGCLGRRGGAVGRRGLFGRNLCGSDRMAVVKILTGEAFQFCGIIRVCVGGAF